MKPQNKQMHCQISPRRTCNPCGYTMKMGSRYHRLLIYDVKRTTKIDGMGPFNCFQTWGMTPNWKRLHRVAFLMSHLLGFIYDHPDKVTQTLLPLFKDYKTDLL